jgi:arylsulfatase
MVDGIAQKPIEDVSLAYTFDKANAGAPTPHQDQYFEMMGVQRLYNDGWMLSAVPVRMGIARQGDPGSRERLQVRAVRCAA